MSKFTGYDMKASFNGVELDCLTSVDVSQQSDVYTKLHAGDRQKERFSVPLETTFTINYLMDTDMPDVPAPGERKTLNFYAGGDLEWTCDGVVTATSISSAVDGLVTGMIEFSGTDCTIGKVEDGDDDMRVHDNWDELRALMERGEVGIWYVNGEYYRIERIERDEDDEMKKVYWLYAANKRTDEVKYWHPFVGSANKDEAKQFALLKWGQEINALGDSADLHVWIEAVGEYKPLKDD